MRWHSGKCAAQFRLPAVFLLPAAVVPNEDKQFHRKLPEPANHLQLAMALNPLSAAPGNRWPVIRRLGRYYNYH